jgi:uncharacterized protein (UPF0248 family)
LELLQYFATDGQVSIVRVDVEPPEDVDRAVRVGDFHRDNPLVWEADIPLHRVVSLVTGGLAFVTKCLQFADRRY